MRVEIGVKVSEGSFRFKPYGFCTRLTDFSMPYDAGPFEIYGAVADIGLLVHRDR